MAAKVRLHCTRADASGMAGGIRVKSLTHVFLSTLQSKLVESNLVDVTGCYGRWKSTEKQRLFLRFDVARLSP